MKWFQKTVIAATMALTTSSMTPSAALADPVRPARPPSGGPGFMSEGGVVRDARTAQALANAFGISNRPLASTTQTTQPTRVSILGAGGGGTSNQPARTTSQPTQVIANTGRQSLLATTSWSELANRWQRGVNQPVSPAQESIPRSDTVSDLANRWRQSVDKPVVPVRESVPRADTSAGRWVEYYRTFDVDDARRTFMEMKARGYQVKGWRTYNEGAGKSQYFIYFQLASPTMAQ